MQQRYTVNDLPRFSPWPARLLGVVEWHQRHRTPQEVLREFDGDKWGRLLSRLENTSGRVTLDDVDRWYFGEDVPVLCTIAGQFELLSKMEAQRRYINFMEDVLRPYLPASALVELGAGYGGVLFALAQRQTFAHIPFIAGEFTPSGVALIRGLAQRLGVAVAVEHCDFSAPGITRLAIPEGAVIYTSYAVMYVPELSDSFVDDLAVFKPKAVVMVEPCYEHCEQETLLGLMRRRYIEVNDYNRNLISLLHQYQQDGRIEILKEEPTCFGMNPLLDASVVAWRPLG